MPGGGRKWNFTEITVEVKLWHEKERRMGHVIDKTDVLNEFTDRLEAKVQIMEFSQQSTELSKEDAQSLLHFKDRLESLVSGTDRARISFTERICAKMGARILVPQRYTALSCNEERVRCQLTWQQWDERCWLASFGR